jgi:hypothetical protein
LTEPYVAVLTGPLVINELQAEEVTVGKENCGWHHPEKARRAEKESRMKTSMALSVILGMGFTAGATLHDAGRAPDHHVAQEGTSEGTAAMPDANIESELQVSDWQFIEASFARYGGIWVGGPQAYEGDFRVNGRALPETYEVTFTWRGVAPIRYVVTFTRDTGLMSGGTPIFPESPELDEQERERVDAILRATGEIWLNQPPNDSLAIVDVTGGIDSLLSATWFEHGYQELDLTTGRIGDLALLYLSDRFGSTAVVVVDLIGGALSEVSWVDFPRAYRSLSVTEIAFIEESIRQHGDWADWGDLSGGLRNFLEDNRVRIRVHDEVYAINIDSLRGNDGLSFDVERTTGEITHVTTWF